MRRLAAPVAQVAAATLAAAAVACASMQAPPGGPEDAQAPELVGVAPESGAVSFRGSAVQFRFDEVISDRGTGAGALDQLVLVSPRTGVPRVSWRRERIAVRPREGWRPNTTYTITLLPGIADLRGNRTTVARTVVVSTGPVPAGLALRGRIFDWLAERPAPRAWVEAIARPDSVVYVTVADSAGEFSVGPLPAGTYTLRGFIDQNTNRALDRAEAWDSVTVQPARAGVETTFELLAAPRDTMPPRISGVSVTDSVTLAIEFDRPLDPEQQIVPALFAVTRADSAPVPVREAGTRRDVERRQEAARARADSIRADSARADTTRAAPAAPRLVRGGPAARPQPSRPAPPTQVILGLGAPLAPGTAYRVSAGGVRNLLGRAGGSSRVVQSPRAAPADTMRGAAPAPP